MAERVEPYEPAGLDAPLCWEPNAPQAHLISDDEGRGALAQRAHPDDPDQRCVVLRWDGVRYAVIGPPNDEARQKHRLYGAGLAAVRWLGLVRDSSLVDQLRSMWSQSAAIPLHFVVVSKECAVEVLAENLDVFRIDGTPSRAAPASLTL